MRRELRCMVWALPGLMACAASLPSTTPSAGSLPAPAAGAGPVIAEPAPSPGPSEQGAEDVEPFLPTSLPEGYVHFEGACDPGTSITIGAVGDVLVHRELQRQALEADDGFANIWAPVLDLMRAPDLMFANLEGPAAWGINRQGKEHPDPGKRFDNRVYTGYARFNYHPSIAADLAASGVDVVATANNHTLDRLALGLDRTLDALDKAKLAHFGTRRQGTREPWHAVTETKGIRLAWVGCTLHMNWQKDEHDQVMQCFAEPDDVTPLIRKLAKDPKIDAVVVAPHFGKEYSPSPRAKETNLVHKFLDAGALLVLGSHPHVLQPWEQHVTPDGRETFAIYSLGNFCSHQRSLPRRSSMILYVGLTKNEAGVVRVNGVRHVPLHVRMEGDKQAFFVEAIDRVGGPADSRKLTIDMFGELNVLAPDEPVVTNPHCARDWPHHSRAQ